MCDGLVTQTNALAVQSAPSLAYFSGEDIETEEKGFEKWVERFEERALLLAWSDKQKLYQLKSHFSKIALQYFQCLTPRQCSTYAAAVE